ncbi:Uncharacterised protein [uncultured archaeon]|nr:Uncharacterised protein [uncultured archaeon]
MSVALSLGNFYGIDSAVEFLIIIVSIIIAYYSNKVYNLIRYKQFRFFSFAFLSIAISFIFKILSNLTIVHKMTIQNADFIFVVWHQFEYMELLNFSSFILYKAFYLIGFLVLFFIITRTKDKEKIFLFSYFCIVAIILSIYFNFIFHITLVFILLFLANHFYENHEKIKSTNSLLVFVAFLIILVSHLFFVFSEMHSLFYLIGEILLLISFLCLLVNQIKLKRESKTKNIKSFQNETRRSSTPRSKR